MLSLHTYISAIYDMGLSYSDLAAVFSVSNGTISNWINGNTKTKYRVKADKIIFGTMGCLQEKKLLPDSFIKALIEKLDISEKEKSFLNVKYNQLGFDDFIAYVVSLALSQAEFVPTAYDYDPRCLLRPVIGAGQNHVLAVNGNGHTHATGLNEDQQCNTHSWRNIVSVTGCWKGSIGLRSDGMCVATGLNIIGDGTLFRWTNITSIAAGFYHVLGLKLDGTVLSFGRNPFGQCNVSGWKNITSIAAGENHSVGLSENGCVFAVGKNDHGQCETHSWKNVRQIAAAGDHTLALLVDGSVTGTGNLGSIKLETLTGAKAIATGQMHAVGLMENGCVVNTGADICGLSDVERWHDMIAIAAGYSITIGVRTDGRVLVTHDKHSQFYLNTDGWKLFEDNKSEKLISQFDKALEKYKQILSSIKRQALTVSPYISEYHNNVKLLDFSHFQEEYENLNSLFTASFQMNQEYPSSPTIQNLTSTLLTAFIDVKDTIKETDDRYYITDGTYQAFMNFLFVINQLEREVRLIKGGISFPELVEKQISDFSPLVEQIPTWK